MRVRIRYRAVQMKVAESHAAHGIAECAPFDALKGKIAGTYMRVLADSATGSLYRVHTVPIDSGGQCEVLVGRAADDTPMVFRQFRVLPPRQRDTLLSGLRRPRVSLPQQVAADVAISRAVGGPCAPQVFLQTYRGAQVSKLYVGMRPMQADLLGCARTLRDRAVTPALRAAFATWTLSQLAWQLEALHARGIVHRDLRLDNVLCGTDAAGQAYLCLADFGNARAPQMEALSRPTGPLPYCAPEVLRGSYVGDFGPRDRPPRDVWALGIICIILLLGTNPFDPERELRDNEAIADTLWSYGLPDGPRLPRELDDFAALGALVKSMLHRDPGLRPTAAEVDACVRDSGLIQAHSMQAAASFAAAQRDLEEVIESRLADLA